MPVPTRPPPAHTSPGGINEAGKRFTHEGKGGKETAKESAAAAAAVTAAAGASCTVYISDLVLGAQFAWQTTQWCSGAFGYSTMSTKIQRSSWSGYRDYTVWANTSNDYRGCSVDAPRTSADPQVEFPSWRPDKRPLQRRAPPS